jgi:hypothetical protein
MQLSLVQNQAIAARMALIVGGATFDRLFAGVRFDEVDGDILYVYGFDVMMLKAHARQAAGWLRS